ncbi:fibronectin type III domain-containing protein, partial [Candidatus Falkowbacteria bacterium]|nr:fibronectin type III domain-containing protein [Candidatus Falkowbacteria bacterium]
VAAPTATAMSFANRVGTVTGNTIDLNLTGVSDADLASAGSITVSDTSTLQITFPVALPSGPIPPVSLTTGANVLTTVDVFGNSILAAELYATAGSFPGGIIPVTGTLTSAAGVTNIAINILVDSASPSIPNALVAAAISASQINLSWSTSTDNVAVSGYKIFRGSSTNQIGTTSATSFSDTGLQPNTIYNYLVSAFDNAGNSSGLSTSTSATTLTVPSSGGGGGGGGVSIPAPCNYVEYSDWQTCSNGIQNRDIKAQGPSFCALTAVQQAGRSRSCLLDQEKPKPEVKESQKKSSDEEGKIIRKNDGKLYIIKNGQEVYIKNLAELQQYLKEKNKRVLGVKIYANGSLLKARNGKIYLLRNGVRVQIPNLKELAKYSKNKMFAVDNETLSSYPEAKKFPVGTLIRDKNKNIYVIKADGKLKIHTMAELRKYRNKPIIEVDDVNLRGN